MNIILIQNWFNSEERHSEYLQCLEKNCENQHIDKILLLCDSPLPEVGFNIDKIITIPVSRIPTYDDYFRISNLMFNNCICIVANLDIYLDETICRVRSYIDDKSALAISRWNLDTVGGVALMEGAQGSQDVWVFKTPINIKNLVSDFTLGVGGCDNRIAFELAKNYTVYNPCLSIVASHLHNINFRSWTDGHTAIRALSSKDGFKMVEPSGGGVISFSLFHVDDKQEHRVWDDHNDFDRYFFNIPAIILTYKHLYPTFKVQLYTTSSMVEHPKFKFLTELHKGGLLELYVVKDCGKGYAPSCLRYIPFFDNKNHFVFSRDLDSIPNLNELASNEFFMSSDCNFSTIRSHENHTGPNTAILAGLCNIKPFKYPHKTNYSGFMKFYNGVTWGVDQEAIIDYVCKRSSVSGVKFLDFPINNLKRLADNSFPAATRIDISDLRVFGEGLKRKHQKLISILESITSWSGQPVDVRGDKLLKLSEVSSEGNRIIDIIKRCNLSEFYKI